MEIRNMILNDYNQVDALMQKLHRIHVEAMPDLYVDIEHPYSFNEFKKKIESSEYILIVAEENDEVIGMCIVRMKERSMMVNMETAYMDDLYVVKEARRKGVATKLFIEAEKKTKEKGAKRLDLMVWEFNRSAMEFYKSLGMKEQRYILEKEL